MKAAIVYLRPRAVVFMRENGPYNQSVAASWNRMFEWLDLKGLRDGVCVGYGLAHDDPRAVAGAACRYDACVELGPEALASVGGEIRSQSLPGGAFARSRVAGGYDKISKVLATIRDGWMPTQGLKVDHNRPIIAVYLSDPRSIAEDARRSDICLPVLPK